MMPLRRTRAVLIGRTSRGSFSPLRRQRGSRSTNQRSPTGCARGGCSVPGRGVPREFARMQPLPPAHPPRGAILRLLCTHAGGWRRCAASARAVAGSAFALRVLLCAPNRRARITTPVPQRCIVHRHVRVVESECAAGAARQRAYDSDARRSDGARVLEPRFAKLDRQPWSRDARTRGPPGAHWTAPDAKLAQTLSGQPGMRISGATGASGAALHGHCPALRKPPRRARWLGRARCAPTTL